MTLQYVNDNTYPGPVPSSPDVMPAATYALYFRDRWAWQACDGALDYDSTLEAYEGLRHAPGILGVKVELTTRDEGRAVEVHDVTDEFETALDPDTLAAAQRDDDAKWADLRAAQMP